MNANFDDYEAQLVKIVDATFADASDTFANGTVYDISDNSKADGKFRTTFFDVDYIGTTIPSGEGNIIGLLNSRTDGDYITSRSLADLEWSLGEPTNYPDNFSAIAYGQAIELSWSDAAGDILPTGYLILASDNPNITAPVDGVPVPNDPDLADGAAAMNIAYGVEVYTFTGLPKDITYYFEIFPYTGAGSVIDYKTDGMPPAAEATTYEMVELLFTTFDLSWEDWIRYNITGEQDWDRDNNYGINNTPCARISGYANQTANENENWLISPAIDLTEYESELLTFYSAFGFDGPALQVKVATGYDGGIPNPDNWTDISDQVIWPTGDPFFEWTHSGYIDISAFGDSNFFIAFVYYSTDDEAATWEVENIHVTAMQTVGIASLQVNDQISLYPNPGTGLFNIETSHNYNLLEVYSLTGQLVHSEQVNNRSFNLEITHLEKGFYFVRFYDTASGHQAVKRIVIN
jgi:hypothetical protein